MISILSIDTSTKACSVAIHNDGVLVASRFLLEDKSHSVKLLSLVQEVLKESKMALKDLSGIAISKGPGSYTGLRIGVSTVKGLCYAADLPLLSVGSLELMANGVKKTVSEDALLCPMIDARRMEVYCTVYDTDLNIVNPIEAKIIDETSFANELRDQSIYFFGDGSAKCKETFRNHSKAKFVDDIHPNAEWMGDLVFDKYKKAEFEDLAYFEPYYLKDFVATIPRKLL